MADTTDNIVIEHLRAIRVTQDQHTGDLRDIRHRLTSIESKVATLTGDVTHMSHRIDRLDERVERIEKRLDIVQEPA